MFVLSLSFIPFILCHLPLFSCQSKDTVEWFAPIFSGGGYCSEALALAASIATVANISFEFRVNHHGDTYSKTYLEGMPANILSAVVSKIPYFGII